MAHSAFKQRYGLARGACARQERDAARSVKRDGEVVDRPAVVKLPVSDIVFMVQIHRPPDRTREPSLTAQVPHLPTFDVHRALLTAPPFKWTHVRISLRQIRPPFVQDPLESRVACEFPFQEGNDSTTKHLGFRAGLEERQSFQNSLVARGDPDVHLLGELRLRARHVRYTILATLYVVAIW